MDHRDHVALLRDGVAAPGGTWADLGAGDGAFTLALADLLGPGSIIYAVDRDRGVLRRNVAAVAAAFPAVEVRPLIGDFTRPIDLALLDGVVMANSLHFVRDPRPVLRLVRGLLRPGGRLIIVEYDTDRGNPWVPHPFSSARWPGIAAAAGFTAARRLGRVPSRFLGAIYSAASDRPA